MKKKLCTLFLTVLFILNSMVSAVGYGEGLQTFSDVPVSHWAFPYISALTANNTISGYPDNSFRPDVTVSRAEFAKMIVSAAGLRIINPSMSSFYDVAADKWYYPYAETAREFIPTYRYNGTIMFYPDEPATREVVAIALVSLKGYDVSAVDTSMIQNIFSDYSGMEEWVKKYIIAAVERGLVSGYEDGTFRAQQPVTRAEAAAMIWRATQSGDDNKAAETSGTTSIPNTALPGLNDTVATPTPEAKVQKPYIVDTLYSTGKIYDYCYDDNDTIYYIEGKSVYLLDINTGKSEKFVDFSEYKNVEERITYYDYIPEEIYINHGNGHVIVNGRYSKYDEPYDVGKSTSSYVLYDITSDNIFLSAIYYYPEIYIIDDNKFICGNSIYNIKNGNSQRFHKSANVDIIDINVVDNTIYGFCKNDANAKIWWLTKFNLNGNEKHLLTLSGFDFRFGFKNEYLYLSNPYNDEICFQKINLATGDVKNLDITINSEKCTILDMAAVPPTQQLIPISDELIIFYDNNVNAFRKIAKI
ncbi:MAG: S-layer homology domain-containing protein [Oscillospiraceae bacterium]|nr:S-layer homology domain-containing protein [Oscillospiraceae bacterium]